MIDILIWTKEKAYVVEDIQDALQFTTRIAELGGYAFIDDWGVFTRIPYHAILKFETRGR